MSCMKTENIEIVTTEKINSAPPYHDDSANMATNRQLYESIIDDIQTKYNGNLSKAKASIAARNFIEFVKIMINHFSGE